MTVVLFRNPWASDQSAVQPTAVGLYRTALSLTQGCSRVSGSVNEIPSPYARDRVVEGLTHGSQFPDQKVRSPALPLFLCICKFRTWGSGPYNRELVRTIDGEK